MSTQEYPTEWLVALGTYDAMPMRTHVPMPVRMPLPVFPNVPK